MIEDDIKEKAQSKQKNFILKYYLKENVLILIEKEKLKLLKEDSIKQQQVLQESEDNVNI